MDYIQQISIDFPYLTTKDINDLMTFSYIKKYEAGEVIIEPHITSPDYFYYVFSGLVRGFGFNNEKESVNFYFIEDKHFFLSPERLLEGKGAISESGFEAVSEVHLIKINYSNLLEKCAQNQGYFEFYHTGLKRILQTFKDRIKLMIISDAYQRYIALAESRPIIIEKAQKRHIAQFLGITPNSFSRILSGKIKKR